MLVRKRARKTKMGDPDEVDDNGILKDIKVPAIEKTAPARSEHTKDVDALFGVAVHQDRYVWDSEAAP